MEETMNTTHDRRKQNRYEKFAHYYKIALQWDKSDGKDKMMK
jgi:hypothetical protein